MVTIKSEKLRRRLLAKLKAKKGKRKRKKSCYMSFMRSF